MGLSRALATRLNMRLLSGAGGLKNCQNLVCFRVELLSIQTDRPFEFRVLAFEFGLNSVHYWDSAASTVTCCPCETLCEFACAVHYCDSAIWQEQGQRCARNTIRDVLRGCKRGVRSTASRAVH